ncbi:Thiol:disulfide interchange protein DsbD [Thalassocella blandensis]|nr:Thiol:disulfide interchange protein DsbD [Thalassocella blandensis]
MNRFTQIPTLLHAQLTNTPLRRRIWRSLTAIATFLWLCQTAFAQNFNTGGAQPFEEEETFLPIEKAYQVVPSFGKNKLELLWTIAPGYYLYQHQFKLEAQTADKSEKFELTFGDGKLKYDEYYEKELTVYYTSTDVVAPLPEFDKPYQLKITSQGCADAGLCYPPRNQYFWVDTDGDAEEISGSKFTNTGANTPSAKVEGSETQQDAFLPWILFGALLGGLILNLMPCVFPVLSLKALSFASSHLNKHAQHLHGWAYTGGVVISFVAAAVVILSARSAGESLGWGFQLQQPGFVATMAFLFFIMGLSLSGLLHIGTQFMGAGQSLTSGHGLSSSFFTGVLAALVASPCTAPFMASALGFALTQPAYIAILVFITLGFGMALPFLLLSYSPALVRYLPQPGAWMEVLKQFLAFPLYLTCIWLLWVLARQTGSDGAIVILIGMLSLTFTVWLLQHASNNKILHFSNRGLAMLGLAFAIFSVVKIGDFQTGSSDNGQWEPYSPDRLKELRAEDTPVFIDLTADWCITCKFNERVALNTDEVIKFAALNDIVMLQGDWTNEDPQISDLLKQFGRSGVPLYLMYPADGNAPPVVLPQILTQSQVLESMENALR